MNGFIERLLGVDVVAKGKQNQAQIESLLRSNASTPFNLASVSVENDVAPADRVDSETFISYYRRSSYVRKAVDKIADAAASVRVHLYVESTGGSLTRLETHESVMAALLENPSNFVTQSMMLKHIVKDKCIFGNSYVAIERSGYGDNYSLVLLEANKVSIVADPKAKVKKFKYDIGAASDEVFYDGSRVCHFYDPSPGDFWFGRSPLSAVVEDVKAAFAAKRNYGAEYRRGRLTSAFFQAKGQIDQSAMAALKQEYGKRKPDSPNAMIVPNDFDVIINSGNSGASGLTSAVDLIKITEDEVCGIYGIPPELFHASNDIVEVEAFWWRNSLLPLLISIEQSLTAFVSSIFESTSINPLSRGEVKDKVVVRFDLDEVPALRMLDLERARVEVAHINTGLVTPNEAREARGLPKYDDTISSFADYPKPMFDAAQTASKPGSRLGSSPSLSMPGSEGGRDQSDSGEAEMIDETGVR